MHRREFVEAAIGLSILGAAGVTHRALGEAASQWRLQTDLVSYSFGWNKAKGLHLSSLKNETTGYEWAKQESCGFAFTSANHRIEGLGPNSGFEFQGYEHRDSKAGARELQLRFLHPALNLELLLSYTSFPNSAVLGQHCRIRNAGREDIQGVRRFDPLFLSIGIPASQLQAYACRINKYAIERLPISGNLEIGASADKPPNGYAGFAVVENSSAQELLFFGIEWGAGWAIRFQEYPSGVQISGGLTEIIHNLAPGDVLESPRIFTGVAHGDRDSASQAMQVFLEKNIFPPKLRDFPWVVYDAWGTRSEGLEKRLLEEIDFAAELGIEVFYHDAAWYAGSSENGSGDWFTGLGTYQQDRRKFPHGGLAYISSRVHQRGMKFGLWVDCAMVDEKLVPGEIPEKWLAKHDGKELKISYKPYQASIIQLCLGDPEVVEHIKGQLGRLISEFHLEWIKWDTSGENGICNRTDHGHQIGDGAYAAERGRYAIWNFLHSNFPELVLEECGGITRQDLGLAPYCRCHWMDDATFPSRHVRENVLAVSFLYPSYYQGSWVVREAEVEQEDPDVLDTIFRSRMIGLFGFGTLYGKLFTERVSLFPKKALEAARRNIPVYKRYRHLLSEDCFHLTAPTSSPEGWQAIEFCKRDKSEAVVIAFRNGSSQQLCALPLEGLEAKGRYQVKSINGRPDITRQGASLRSKGVTLDLPKPMMSEVLLLRRL